MSTPTLSGVAVVILAVLLAVAGLGGTQAEERVFLLFVDDLHLEVRSTPRLRELMTRQIVTTVGDPRTGDVMRRRKPPICAARIPCTRRRVREQ